MFELFEPDSQFGSVGAGKSNKGRASVSQSSNITLSQQRQRCFCFAITGSADDEIRAFSKAFGLEPRLAASASVLR